MRVESLRVYNRFKRNNNDNSVDLLTSTWRAQSVEMKLFPHYGMNIGFILPNLCDIQTVVELCLHNITVKSRER